MRSPGPCPFSTALLIEAGDLGVHLAALRSRVEIEPAAFRNVKARVAVGHADADRGGDHRARADRCAAALELDIDRRRRRRRASRRRPRSARARPGRARAPRRCRCARSAPSGPPSRATSTPSCELSTSRPPCTSSASTPPCSTLARALPPTRRSGQSRRTSRCRRRPERRSPAPRSARRVSRRLRPRCSAVTPPCCCVICSGPVRRTVSSPCWTSSFAAPFTSATSTPPCRERRSSVAADAVHRHVAVLGLEPQVGRDALGRDGVEGGLEVGGGDAGHVDAAMIAAHVDDRVGGRLDLQVGLEADLLAGAVELLAVGGDAVAAGPRPASRNSIRSAKAFAFSSVGWKTTLRSLTRIGPGGAPALTRTPPNAFADLEPGRRAAQRALGRLLEGPRRPVEAAAHHVAALRAPGSRRRAPATPSPPWRRTARSSAAARPCARSRVPPRPPDARGRAARARPTAPARPATTSAAPAAAPAGRCWRASRARRAPPGRCRASALPG